MNTYYESKTLDNEGVTTGTEDTAAIATVGVKNISVHKIVIVRINIGGRDGIVVRNQMSINRGGSKKDDNEVN